MSDASEIRRAKQLAEKGGYYAQIHGGESRFEIIQSALDNARGNKKGSFVNRLEASAWVEHYLARWDAKSLTIAPPAPVEDGGTNG